MERDVLSWAGKCSGQLCEISLLCKLEGLSLDAQRPSENPGVCLCSPLPPALGVQRQVDSRAYQENLILTSSLHARTHLPAHSPLSNLAQTGTCTPITDSSVVSHPGHTSEQRGLLEQLEGIKGLRIVCVWGRELGCSRHEAWLASRWSWCPQQEFLVNE